MDVLVIDDEIDICEILSAQLNALGYECGFAQDSEAATKIVAQKSPPLLICDITMPGKSGLQLLENLKKQGGMHAAVMLTAHAESKMIVEALQLGAIDYIIKPFEISDLEKKLPAWIEIGRRIQEVSTGKSPSVKRTKEQIRMIDLFRLKSRRASKKAG